MVSRAVSLVVAYSLRTRAIGLRYGLPWPELRRDLARLKALTKGHTVVMGRKSFESIEMDSVPLSGRRHIILSRDPGWVAPPGAVHAADWAEALLLADAGFGGAGYDDGTVVRCGGACGQSVFVLGGEEVYRTALLGEQTKTVFATEIEEEFEGDAFFPELDLREWRRIGDDEGGEGFAEILGPEFCPKGWAAGGRVRENGVTYRFVTYERLTEPAVVRKADVRLDGVVAL